MARLDIERQKELEPIRMEYAKKKLESLGIEYVQLGDIKLTFVFKGHPVNLFTYSGWFTGKMIKDGRGIEKLLKQLI